MLGLCEVKPPAHQESQQFTGELARRRSARKCDKQTGGFYLETLAEVDLHHKIQLCCNLQLSALSDCILVPWSCNETAAQQHRKRLKPLIW